MPIADCGFPAISPLPAASGAAPQFVTGIDLLAAKGPTTPVEIGFDQNMFHTDPATVQSAINAVASAPTSQLVEALIDTGAGESAIDEDLAKALKLPLIDQVDGSGIGGTEKFNVYLGHIKLTSLGFIEFGRFMGVKLQAGQQPHRALLGRSILRRMILVYDGRDGTCKLAV
jgi:predicted aspartyl protease